MPLTKPLTTAEAVVFCVELVYFPLLALVYGLANALRGVLGSEGHEDSIPTRATGPGGRPLPTTKQKKNKPDGPERPPPRELEFTKLTRRLFKYGSVCVVLTFVANAASIVSHTLAGGPKDGWWCGEETAVSPPALLLFRQPSDVTRLVLSCWRPFPPPVRLHHALPP